MASVATGSLAGLAAAHVLLALGHDCMGGFYVG